MSEAPGVEADADTERYEHFNGQHSADNPPHEYQCEHGCPYESEADQAGREAREAESEARYAEYAAEVEAEPEAG